MKNVKNELLEELKEIDEMIEDVKYINICFRKNKLERIKNA